MSKGRRGIILALTFSFLLLGGLTAITLAKDVPRITKEELKSMLGQTEVIIIDVRTGGDWKKSKEKIQGAVREDPGKDVKSWADKYSKDKTLILYCA
jgi:rhodanese-related sulfurtransferase